MDAFKYLKKILEKEVLSLCEAGYFPSGINFSHVSVESPRDSSHGHAASNLALVLSKQVKCKPKEIAELLVPRLESYSDIEICDIAGPGFINLTLSNSFWHSQLSELIDVGKDYGRVNFGKNKKVNIEYVSANPTGPLHVGHGRGTVFGDVLGNLLEAVGFDVTREYYINDGGAQVDILARSVYLRYREALGETITKNSYDGMYPGDYLILVGKQLVEKYNDKYKNSPESEWLNIFRKYSIEAMMRSITNDLKAIGVTHDVFFSERSLVVEGKVDKVIKQLKIKGHIYHGTLEKPKGENSQDEWESRPQLLFSSKDFGDDTDRPLKKSDGSWTYFATDIAYHADKANRGFTKIIDIWGADHGGYVKRLQGALHALSDSAPNIEIKLCQLVRLLDKGVPVKMSKRAGQFVTLRDLVDEVGKDVVRFIMLTRKNEAQLDFDLTEVCEQSRENPVFYVQYAHARVCSVIRTAKNEITGFKSVNKFNSKSSLHMLIDQSELSLIRTLTEWPRVLETAASVYEPHRLAFYLLNLAGEFHSLWNRGTENPNLKFIIKENIELTTARLSLIESVGEVIASGLNILGVEPAKEMR